MLCTEHTIAQQGSVLSRQSELRWHGHWPHLLKDVTVRLESEKSLLDLSIMELAILFPLVGLSDGLCEAKCAASPYHARGCQPT